MKISRFSPSLSPHSIFVLLIFLGFAIFGKSLSFPFIYDDHWTIVQNPSVKTASPISRYFTDRDTVAAPEMKMGGTIYRPLPTASFALNAKLDPISPWKFRSVNLFIHGLNAVLLAVLLAGRLGFSTGAAFMGGLIFLIHPAQVESVVWITQRSNLMCLAGILSAMIFYLKRTRGRTILLLLCLSAALFSKETAAVFPVLALLAPGAAGKKIPRLPLLAVSAVTAAYFVARSAVVGPLSQRPAIPGDGLVGGLAWWEYLKLTFLASPFRASHWRYVDSPSENPWTWVGLALLLSCGIAAAYLWRKREKRAAFFAAWVPIALSPVLGLVPIDNFVAERFLYVPLAGIAGLAAVLWDGEKTRSWARRLIPLFALISAVLTVKLTNVWRDETSLWTHAVRIENSNPFAWICLGAALRNTGSPEAAEKCYIRGLTSRPSVFLAYSALNNLAEIQIALDRPRKALTWADRALRIEPDSPTANFQKIRALLRLGHSSDAAELLSRMKSLHPQSPLWREL